MSLALISPPPPSETQDLGRRPGGEMFPREEAERDQHHQEQDDEDRPSPSPLPLLRCRLSHRTPSSR